VIWAELRSALIELLDAEPDALTEYPDPRSDDQQPPFSVGLAPWAVEQAERLHRQFGAEIELTVGVLGFPMPTSTEKASRPSQNAALPELTELDIQLDGEAVVRSGVVLKHAVLLANRGLDEVTLHTNRQLTAEVVDPASGEVVGGTWLPQRLPLVRISVPPGDTVRVPLLIGTASLNRRLGYTVPAGNWGLRIPVSFTTGTPGGAGRWQRGEDVMKRISRILPLTIRN
jgi:hypothetical protein